MLIYITTRIVSSTTAFLYPGYASYKTLSQRPANEEELERWLMYWSVLGCIVGVEYVAEWLISWIPFYYTLKMIFLLYLALPQTRGSSYLYNQYLQPFFQAHEQDIDAALVRLKSRAYTFVTEKLRVLWEQLLASLGHPVGQPTDPNNPPVGGAGPHDHTAVPPTLGDPVSGPAQLLGGLWRNYGPSIIAGGATLLSRTSQAPGAAASFLAPGAGATRTLRRPPSTQSLLDRRRELEAELARIDATAKRGGATPGSSGSGSSDGATPPFPTPIPHKPGSSAYLPPSASDADLHARVGQFEEVEVPSDVEGYDASFETPARPTAGRPDPARRTSWFGWGAAGGSPSSPKAKDE